MNVWFTLNFHFVVESQCFIALHANIHQLVFVLIFCAHFKHHAFLMAVSVAITYRYAFVVKDLSVASLAVFCNRIGHLHGVVLDYRRLKVRSFKELRHISILIIQI